MEDCLPPNLLRALCEDTADISSPQPQSDSLLNGSSKSPRPQRKRLNMEMSSPSSADVESPSKVARTVKIETPTTEQHRPPVPCGASLQFCVDRALAMLQLGHNAIIIDKTTYVDGAGTSQPHTWHRAKILSRISRSCLGEASVDSASLITKFKGRSKKMGQTSRWGPILVVVKAKDLFKWEEVFQEEYLLPVAGDNGATGQVRLMTYCGAEEDRSVLRSYLTPANMYTQRAHCHIVLTHYEALATDLVHLKWVHWQLMILDSAWSILSHSTYKHYMYELLGLTCRHRILSCSQLGFYKAVADKSSEESKAASLLRTYFPDPLAALRFVFPSVWDMLEQQLNNEDGSDALTQRLITHVLSALTAVCDESLSSIIKDGCSEEDVKLYYDITEHLPWLEWEGVGYVLQPSESRDIEDGKAVTRYKVLFDIDHTVHTTVSYVDEEMARELKGLKMESIGKVINTQRRRSRNRGKAAGTVLSVPTGEDGAAPTERKKPGRKRGWAAAAAAAASAAKIKEELDRLEGLEEGLEEEAAAKEQAGGGEEGSSDNDQSEKSGDEDDGEGEGDRPSESQETTTELSEIKAPSVVERSTTENSIGSVPDRPAVGTSAAGEGEDEAEEGDGGADASTSLAAASPLAEADIKDMDESFCGKESAGAGAERPENVKGGGTSQFPKPIAIKKYDPEDEKKRSICQRGDQWQVTVAFPGRVRFFGSFSSEKAAMQTYQAALLQRSALQEDGLTCLPRMKFIGDKHGAYALGGTGAGKKRKSKELMTDEQLIARMTDDK